MKHNNKNKPPKILLVLIPHPILLKKNTEQNTEQKAKSKTKAKQEEKKSRKACQRKKHLPRKKNHHTDPKPKRKKTPTTLSPCDAAAILQPENNIENTNCPHSTPYSPTPKQPPQNYKITQKIQYPKSRMHAKLQSQKAAKQ